MLLVKTSLTASWMHSRVPPGAGPAKKDMGDAKKGTAGAGVHTLFLTTMGPTQTMARKTRANAASFKERGDSEEAEASGCPTRTGDPTTCGTAAAPVAAGATGTCAPVVCTGATGTGNVKSIPLMFSSGECNAGFRGTGPTVLTAQLMTEAEKAP